MAFSIIDSAMSAVADLLVNNLYKGIKGGIEERHLRSAIDEYSRKYFKEKYDFFQFKEEFDFNSLNEWLADKLHRIIAIESQFYSIRTHYEIRLIQEACAVSIKFGDPNADIRGYHVNIYVTGVLHVVREHLIEKVSQNEKVLAGLISDDIKKNIECEVRELEDRLLYEINYRNSFEEMIDSIEFYDNSTSGFSYHNKEIRLQGRVEECLALDRFLSADQSVLFWAVTGPAGTGKSKFVLEYVRRKREDPNWRICYLKKDAGHIDKIRAFTSWEYPMNLLLVVDYAGSCAESLYELLVAIQVSRRSKLRLLLIERQGIEKDKQGQAIEPDWFYRLHGSKSVYSDSGSSVIQKKYNDSVYPDFLCLDQLTDEMLSSMIDDYSAHVKKRKLLEEEKALIFTFVKSIECKEETNNETSISARPLFILFTTDAVLNNNTYRDWDQTALVGYIIERNKDYWKNTVCKKDMPLYEAIEKLLVYTTSTLPWERGKKLDEPFNEATALINSLSNTDAARLFCGISDNAGYDGFLSAIEPDIVGELFVLGYLHDLRETSYLDAFFKFTLQHEEQDNYFCSFFEFLRKCIEDYGNHQVLGGFIIYMIDQLLNLSISNKARISLTHLLALMIEKQDITVAKELIRHLEVLLGQQLQNEQLAENYATGLVNLAFKEYASIGADIIDRFEMLSRQWQKNEKIAYLYSISLVIVLTTNYQVDLMEKKNYLLDILRTKEAIRNSGNQESERHYVELKSTTLNRQGEKIAKAACYYLENLSKQWPENELIAVEYAQGLVMQTYMIDESHVVAEKIHCLKSLLELWPKNEEIAVGYSRGLISLSYLQDVDGVLETIQCLERLLLHWLENEAIALSYVKSIKILVNKQKSLLTPETVYRLEELVQQWSANEKIAQEYAKYLFSLLKHQGNALVTDTLCRLELLSRQWPKNEIIAQEYAKGLFYYIKHKDAALAVVKIRCLEELSEQWQVNKDIKMLYSKACLNQPSTRGG